MASDSNAGSELLCYETLDVAFDAKRRAAYNEILRGPTAVVYFAGVRKQSVSPGHVTSGRDLVVHGQIHGAVQMPGERSETD